MIRTSRFVLSLLALTPFLLCAQSEAGKPVRKRGTLFKEDVDMLVDAICKHARGGSDSPALGGDSILANAQILCAMGHCHRFYHRSDGPIVRPTINALLRARGADGSFGGGDDRSRAVATGWVADALSVMDADAFRDEIGTARQWLEKQNAPGSPWQLAVSAVLAQVRTDLFPQQLAESQAEFARAAAPASLNAAAAAPALVQLVACQAANRLLDKAQGSPAPAFSPAQQKAFDFLLGQQKDGVFSATFQGKSFPDPAFTGFGLMALQTKPKESRSKQEQETIEQGLRWLVGKQNEDGSFGRQVLNYTTSVVVGALARWGDPAAKPVLEKAQKFLLKCQMAEHNGYQSSDRDYGAMGYGGNNSQRADLSNLNFALQALRESGLPADHEAFTKAVTFLQRTQNLKATNDFTGKVPDPDQQGKVIEATSGDDGGAAYYPGNSAAGYEVLPDGKSIPRSYGSMTYALLKSYTLCGIKPDDPRVQAAVKWISANWTLAVNPGCDPKLGDKVPYQGLFYYYMVLAQALDLAGVKEVAAPATADSKPAPLDWRKALRAHLEGMQQANGSWINQKNNRWMEDSEILCSCYAMVALERCR